ncbi:MAG: hypothetical protein J4G09_10475 [Proteobacteria bacterium]|nr:hypothetical protein [Pseudomonadota bacterium]
MHLEREFSVPAPRDAVARALDRDSTFEGLFPDTRVSNRGGGVRETVTRVALAGSSRDLRFVFEVDPLGNVHFRKICDGRIWRSLDGEIRLDALGDSSTRVTVCMDGKSRALVPERALSGPLRSQLDEMVESLRKRVASPEGE